MLLLEAGGKDRDPWIHIPAGFYRNIYNPKVAWHFETEPVPEMNNRRIPWPRGKVLGGSSSINGLIYIRGQRRISTCGARSAMPAGRMTTCCRISARRRTRSAAPTSYHGAGGPLDVSDLRSEHELHDAFIAGGAGGRLPAQPRLQRRRAGGRRAAAAHRAQGAAVQRRAAAICARR